MSAEDLDGTEETDPRLVEIAATIRSSPSETVVPDPRIPSQRSQIALEGLAAYRAATPSMLPRQLELGETLGEGGMGVIRVARQTILNREVAVKSPRTERPTDSELQRMMQEAWVTGALEHPNIVPVHDVSIGADGRPHIVLKRVTGSTWDALLRSEDTLRAQHGVDDPLEWHLRVFLQICNAVEFAHSREIVHRDLKPENVMIGDFGEVYLLDWGIAVSLEHDPTGRLPSVRNATQLAGTPAYMAPEMLGGDPPRIERRTDVYLLGAVLHEVVTGRPPHQGDALMAVITSVSLSEPTLDPDTPEELKRIVRRAMSAKIEDRYPDVDALRTAVESFLRHRGSAALTRETRERLATLEAAIAATDGRARDELYNLFGACEFGFRAALESWPENRDAKQGLREAVEAMARYELANGDPRAARTLVKQPDEIGPELLAQIEAAIEARDAEERRTQALAESARQMDTRIGARTRWGIALGLGLIWAVAPLGRLLVVGDGPLGVVESLSYNGAVGAAAALAFFWRREAVLASRYNRLMFGSLLVLLGAQFVMAFASIAAGSSTVSTELVFAMTFAICAMIALMMEPKLWLTTAGYGASWFAVIAWPEGRWLLISLSNVVLIIALLWILSGAPGAGTELDASAPSSEG